MENKGPVLSTADLDRLADMLADKIIEKMPKVQPYLISKKDLDVLLGNGRNSSKTREIINDPSFPAPLELTEGGNKKWRYADVVAYINRRFNEDSKMLMRAKFGRL